MKNNIKISVIGLGKLGLCTATCFASKGYDVIGVDINDQLVNDINSGKSPIEEPGLQELLSQSVSNIRATTSIPKAIKETDVSFIIVPTPSNEDGSFSNGFVISVIEEIGKALITKDSFHVVSVTSTVMPGTTASIVKPLLEELSGKVCGVDFGLVYNPEFIALGSVIKDFLHPDMILIGESDAKAGDIVQSIYDDVCVNEPHYTRMSWVNAELTKLSINCYVTMKISYANTLAAVCERLPGADVDVVADAVGHDSRIGTKYIKGALGFGGPCFPRDNRAFIQVAKDVMINAELAEAVINVNESQVERICSSISDVIGDGNKITVLGLSYKPETNVIEESQSIAIATNLIGQGFDVTVYDPAVTQMHLSDINLSFSDSIKNAVADCDLCVIATPWREFNSLDPSMLKSEAIVFDCWRLLDSKKFVNYVAVGKDLMMNTEESLVE